MQIAVIAAVVFFLFWGAIKTKPVEQREAPYISVPKKSAELIAQYLDIKDNDVFYELGCGDGRVIAAAYNFNPRARYVGIEKSLYPYLLARWQLGKVINTGSVDLVRKDLFKCNLSGATVIYTYLYPHIMDRLMPKLKDELKPGTKLVSCDFTFKEKVFDKMIDLRRPEKTLGRKLYIYYF